MQIYPPLMHHTVKTFQLLFLNLMATSPFHPVLMSQIYPVSQIPALMVTGVKSLQWLGLGLPK